MFVKQVCEHDYVEIQMINDPMKNYRTIADREPSKMRPLNDIPCGLGIKAIKLATSLLKISLRSSSHSVSNDGQQVK